MKFDVLKVVGGLGLDPQEALGSVLHYATPKLAKAAFVEAFKRTSDDGCKKIGRLLSMAGEKLQRLDRDGAAGDCGRVVGEIKLN